MSHISKIIRKEHKLDIYRKIEVIIFRDNMFLPLYKRRRAVREMYKKVNWRTEA